MDFMIFFLSGSFYPKRKIYVEFDEFLFLLWPDSPTYLPKPAFDIFQIYYSMDKVTQGIFHFVCTPNFPEH